MEAKNDCIFSVFKDLAFILIGKCYCWSPGWPVVPHIYTCISLVMLQGL